MAKYKEYIRTNIAEMRDVTSLEVEEGLKAMQDKSISVSQADIDNGSPVLGDKIARNPKNHNDKWLVAKKYCEDNFKLK